MIQKKHFTSRHRNLYVKGFHHSFIEANFLSLFNQFGEIESYYVPPSDNNPLASKGFGFVCYAHQEDADKCLRYSVYPGLYDENRFLFVGRFLSKEELLARRKLQADIKHHYASESLSQSKEVINKIPKVQLRSKINQLQLPPEKLDYIFFRADHLSDEQAMILVNDGEILEKWVNISDNQSS